METLDKLEILGPAAEYDTCNECGGGKNALKSPWRYIYHATLPGGGSVSLFKVLLTNVCLNDCAYCVNQIGRDTPRTTFQPEELAKLFLTLYQRRMVQGLFLSSGTGVNPSHTMESMIKTVEILRYQHKFKGYIHLKILPGASFQYVEAACRLASRVSVNIETPTAKHLATLSSKKDLSHGILEPMEWVRKLIVENKNLAPAGQTTQFVVGAAGDTDRDILHATAELYREMKLRRAYFSAFRPVANSRLEGLSPTPPIRESRLYQADWLLREYHFSSQEVELALGNDGNLPLTKNPKMVIALKQPGLFPVDLDKASYQELLRVPGIGPISAKRITQARRDHSIVSLKQLGKMGVVTKQATPFIQFVSMLNSERQLSFLPSITSEEPITTSTR